MGAQALCEGLIYIAGDVLYPCLLYLDLTMVRLVLDINHACSPRNEAPALSDSHAVTL